jgi:geranylgeranyl diphosphate synthase type II
MGALIAGADEKSCRLLYDFGILTGIAFQLQDDWLDVYGAENSFGKQIGGDICENKKTFILLKAMEMSDQKNKAQLQDWMGRPDFNRNEKIDAVRKIFTESGASDATRARMKEYHDLALESLQQLNMDDSAKTELRNFAAKVLSREK